MSVIIRLQNLPWSANALDIRNYFHGLSIPEGGVHIVGGELGDAFIAFSTDEDARQAMLNTGGKIKEVQVNLLLSSRSEMHKVIEAARQTVPFMQLSQPVVPQPTVLSQSLSSMLIQNMKQNPLAVNSLTNITQKIESPMHLTQEEPIIVPDVKDKDIKRRDSKGERKSARSRSKSRDRDSKKDRGREKKDKRDRSRSRDRSRDRRRRDRSNSYDRSRGRRDRKDRSRSRERERTRESDPRRSRDKKPEDKKPDRELGKPDVVVQNNSPQPLFNQNNLNNNNNRWSQPFNNNNANNGNNATNFNVPPPGIPQQTFPNSNANKVGPFNSQIRPRNNAWDGPKQGSGSPFENRNFNPVNNRFNQTSPVENNDRNANSFQLNGPPSNISKNFDDFKPNFANRTFDKTPRFDKQFQNRRFQGDSKDLCVKLVNIPYHIGYNDIKNFFTGAIISNNGIKMINDSKGRKTGTIFIKFSSPDDKDFAIQKSGQFFKGANIFVSHVEDDEYNRAVDNYQPPENEEEILDSPDEDGSQQNLVICEKLEPIIERIYTVLCLEELPQSTKEHDIIRIFSNYSLLSIMIVPSNDSLKQQTAYVQFVKVEDARVAFNNRANHYIRHKLIKTSPCYPDEYEKIKSASVEASNIPIDLDEPPNTEVPEIVEPALIAPKPIIPESRDPRQKRFEIPKEDPVPFQNPLLQFPNLPPMPNSMIPPNMVNMPNQRFPWRPPLLDQNFNPNLGMNMPMGLPFHNQMIPNNNMDNRNDGFNNSQMPLDCVLLKNLPLRTTDRDILDFFSDVGIIPVRIHIMLNTQGQPSGDCFCEFNQQEEADKAASKNGSMLGMNLIMIELVTRALVEEALGQPPTDATLSSGMLRGNLRGGRGGIIPRGAPRGHMNNSPRGGNMTEDYDSRGGNFRGNFRGGRGNFTPRGRGAPRGNNMRGNYREGRGGFNSFRQPQHENTNIDNPESFGKPGCVLAMENLPFRAGTEDVLDFFRGFGLNHDDIIRRFDERGLSTGEARVSFRSSHDASQALQKMNKRLMQGRPVSIRLL